MERIIFNLLVNAMVENLYTSGGEKNLKADHQYSKAKRKRRAMLLFKLRKSSSGRNVPKIVRYIKIVESYPEDVFPDHFRMSKSTFQKLCTLIKLHWPSTSIGRPSIDLKYSLYVTLWALANKNCLRELSDRFGIAKGSVNKYFKKTCKIICKMKSHFIRFPTNNEIDTTVNKFNNLRFPSFPGVLGCIDCMHIPIPAPLHDPISYFNRKGFHSIIVQAVCNSDLIFSDVFIGWPGRSHDASVWKSSPLYEALNEKKLQLPPDVHLVGDSAYPINSFLMVPYKDTGCLTLKQKIYNSRLSSTRVCVEQSFGILKSKFQALKFLNVRNLEHAKNVILTCVALHNFIIKNEGMTCIPHENCCEETNRECEGDNLAENDCGKIKRNRICENL